MVSLLAVAGLLAACVAEPPSSGGTGSSSAIKLHANVVSGGIELTWTSTINGQSNGYELSYWTADSQTWTHIPTDFDADAFFADVIPGERYTFRVRSKAGPGSGASGFSPSVIVNYAVPTLPIMRIDTAGHQAIVNKDVYLNGTYTLDPNGSSVSPFNGTLRIRGRGNMTWTAPKKPYKLKLDSKAALMGLTKSKSFELLANYSDKSQLRAEAASQISKLTDLAWTPSYRHVEVILNGDYVGVYQLAEKGKVDSDRVDITEMSDTDNSGEELTGGYLMEIDARYTEKGNPGFTTTKNVPVAFEEPDPPTAAQKQYMTNYVQTFETTLFSSTYKDPANGYAKYLDLDAYIDHFLVQEILRNQDAFWSSTYFYKDRSQDKLVFGPIWDFDISMGNPKAVRHLGSHGWDARTRGPWNQRLFTDPAFVDLVADRFDDLAPQILATVPAALVNRSAELAPAINSDAARWGYTPADEDSGTYLSDWLTDRVDWLSDQFDD